MSYPVKGDVLLIPAYSAESEQAAQEIQWSQSFRTRTARYYIVRAQNQSKGNVDVLLYVQDRFYKDSSSNDYIGRLPGARQEGNSWIVSISDRFQYGQGAHGKAGSFISPSSLPLISLYLDGSSMDLASPFSSSLGPDSSFDSKSGKAKKTSYSGCRPT